MLDINLLVRDNVRNLIPYSSARDEFRGRHGIFLDANENPYGKLNRYPDPYQQELKLQISRIKQMPAENIFLGNGSDEIIDLAFRTFCRPGIDKVLTFPPTYGMYEVSAGINDIPVIKVPLTDKFQINMEKTVPLLDDPHLKLIFICSPNNPTGNLLNSSDIKYIIEHSRGIVLIDEAYNDFSGKQSFNTMIARYPNLIVMQTFSKASGLAAARIGMAFTDQKTVQYFNKLKPPYNISSLNQKAAAGQMTHYEKTLDQVRKIISERDRLKTVLGSLKIVEEIYPSDANFLLVRVKDPDYIYKSLAASNIIVRNRSRVVPGCLRITIGTKPENNRLIAALKRISI
ncbi:MAG TPA: histidinol-phosphate transaminase [Bacteroidales bacterium]|jgi:histidinol-phosphate aminotransferase|nr:histidinol-phosphate transaminase [Bacteroidales bacterium]HNR43213.1 histidinol-phosphate transaminase [Bacteroidales bacterium]HPM17950.1 histidinol-phosphate transaminase [Bacteroidales bacterium]HQG76915.1 histidinol-phosphate transaminase [Bacteroidales bacterium]